MIPYLLIIGIPLVVHLLLAKDLRTTFDGPKTNSTIIFAFFLGLFVLLALRDPSIGVDIKTYRFMFDTISVVSWDDFEFWLPGVEVGFIALTRAVQLVSPDFQFYLVVMAMLSIVPVAVLYKRESKSALVTIAFFLVLPLFSMSFSGLRQSLAISIVAVSFFYVKKRKPIKFVLLIILATLFHQSAAIALLIYPIYHARISNRALVAVVPFIAVLFLFNGPIFSMVLGLIGGRYAENYSITTGTGAYSTLFILILIGIAAYTFPSKRGADDDEYFRLRNLLLLSICIQCFAPVQAIAMRMNYYFLLFLPVFAPMVIERLLKSRSSQLGLMLEHGFVVLGFVYFIYSGLFGGDVLQIFPYVPFWGKL